MKTSNTGEVVGLRIFGGKIAPVGGLAISHFQKMGGKFLSLPIGKFLGEKKGGIPRIQNSGDTILNSTRFAE